MKKYRSLICILLAALMAFTLCACSKDKDKESSDPKSDVSASDPANESSVTPTPTPVPEETVEVVVVNGDGVYIRASASTEQEPLGYADSGATFQLVSKDNPDWFQIKYEGQDAYITTLYSELKSIKKSAYDSMFPEVPETSDENGEEPAGDEEPDEESSGVVAEDTREAEDGER